MDHSKTAVHVSSQGALQRLQRACLSLAITATLGGLAGCGYGSANKSDSQALKASNKASRLTASAGDFRPKASFPGMLSQPIMSHSALMSYVQQQKHQARHNPSAYLQPQSVERDLHTADQILREALQSPEMNYQYKELLLSQAGFVKLAESERALLNASAKVNNIRFQSDHVALESLKVAGYQAQMAPLQTAAQGGNAYASQLAAAQQAQSQAAATAQTAAAQVADLQAKITRRKADRISLISQGMALQDKSHVTTGEASLALFKQSVARFHTAAALSQQVEDLNLQLANAQADATMAASALAAAKRQVSDLTEADKAAKAYAAGMSEQAQALTARVQALINNPHSKVPTLQQQLVSLESLYHSADKQAAAAASAARSARHNLTLAANEQRMHYVEAQQLTAKGMSAFDPLVTVQEDKTAECLLDIYQAVADLRAGQADWLRVIAGTLAAQTASDAGKAYAVVSSTSPMTAPTSKQVEQYRTAATAALKQALSDLKQAAIAYPSGQSPVKWLTPALKSIVETTYAGVTSNTAQATALLSAASDDAKAAKQLNPFLPF